MINESVKKLHIAVIGTGFIGKQHIEAIRRIPGAEVIAVVDSNIDVARKISEGLAIPFYYSDYHEMLQNKSIDVVHNCTPSSLHFSINKAIMESGKHVYCEKPLTVSSQESEQLVRFAQKYHVAAGMNMNYRFNTFVQEMRQRVAQGSIGRTMMVYCEYLQDWLLYDTDYDWRMDSSLGGVSRAVADIGSHCFDTAQFIVNKKITEVYARLITVHPIRKRCQKTGGSFSASTGLALEEIPVHSEDAAYIMAKFEDGTPALFQISQVCAGKKNGLSVTISGSQSALQWSQETPDKLWVGHKDVPNETVYADAKYLTDGAKKYAGLPAGHALGWQDALKNAISAFYHSILTEGYLNQQHEYADFAYGNEIMKLVEACLKSNETDKWVKLSNPSSK